MTLRVSLVAPEGAEEEAAWRWLMQPAAHGSGASFLDAVGGFVRRNPVLCGVIAGALGVFLGSRMVAARSRR